MVFMLNLIFHSTWQEAFPKGNPFSSPSVSGAMVGSGRVMFFTMATDEMMPIVFNLWFF